jgi:ribosomal protein S27E
MCATARNARCSTRSSKSISTSFARILRRRALRSLEFVEQEFDAYLACGRLEHGFLRVRCEQCHAGQLVGFSCKRRGFCPSCDARRMAETAALLVDEILPRQPLRRWVAERPRIRCGFLFPAAPTSWAVCWPSCTAPLPRTSSARRDSRMHTACTGAVTQVQRFGSALNLNINWHMLFLDGVYTERADGLLCFHHAARRRSWSPATIGSRSTQTLTSLRFLSYQEWSGDVAHVSASGRPSIALKRAAV